VAVIRSILAQQVGELSKVHRNSTRQFIECVFAVHALQIAAAIFMRCSFVMRDYVAWGKGSSRRSVMAKKNKKQSKSKGK
jgi:hypothetical protein